MWQRHNKVTWRDVDLGPDIMGRVSIRDQQNGFALKINGRLVDIYPSMATALKDGDMLADAMEKSAGEEREFWDKIAMGSR